jgi:hypothetical protein
MSILCNDSGHYFNEGKILTNTEKSAARRQTGKVHMSATATGLTSQAGLIPVIKYLCRIGFENIINQAIPHQRGDNAVYQLSDGILLTLVGMIGGATSLA